MKLSYDMYEPYTCNTCSLHEEEFTKNKKKKKAKKKKKKKKNTFFTRMTPHDVGPSHIPTVANLDPNVPCSDPM